MIETCRKFALVREELGLETFIGPDQDEREGIAAHMETRGLSAEQCLLVRDGGFYETVIEEIMRRRSP